MDATEKFNKFFDNFKKGKSKIIQDQLSELREEFAEVYTEGWNAGVEVNFAEMNKQLEDDGK